MSAVSLADIGTAVTVISVLIGGLWTLIKLAGRQFEKALDVRFKALEEIHQAAKSSYDKHFERLETTERDYVEFKTTVHRDFVRRDDFIREYSSIKVMIDNLGLNIERKLSELWREMGKEKS